MMGIQRAKRLLRNLSRQRQKEGDLSEELQFHLQLEIEKNINAGVKYLNFIMENYFKDAPMNRINRGLFAFASYNAGAARIAGLRKEAAKRGLDPNVWFHNVEYVAAEKIGAETVTYVSNIFKYYVAYRLIMQEKAEKEAATKALKTQ